MQKLTISLSESFTRQKRCAIPGAMIDKMVFVVATDNGVREVASIIVSASAATTTAEIRLHLKGESRYTVGKATGYGYHKESAAVFEALKKAGVEIMGEDGKAVSLDGAGSWWYAEVIQSIANSAGFTGKVFQF